MSTETERDGGASEKAVEAAAVAVVDPEQIYVSLAAHHWDATIGRMASDPTTVALARHALDAAHSSALGLDRSVCLRDVVEWLRGRTGAHGGGFTCADDVVDAIAREFGGQS